MKFENVRINGIGKVLLKVSEFEERYFDSKWGFFLTDGVSVWDGGIGIADNATIVPTKKSSVDVQWAKMAIQSNWVTPNFSTYSLDDIV